jgi:magnesium-transporting ATPase (P-type)
LSRLFSASKPPAYQEHHHETSISRELLESAQGDSAAVLQRLHTETNGLTVQEARTRLKQYGPNEIAKESSDIILIRLSDFLYDALLVQCLE